MPWGGSIENRARVHLEIINKCRKEVGEDFPISVKLNSTDFQKGGFTADESIQGSSNVRKCGCRYYRNFRWYL
jgi:2,4-dienoyl-CoA reductase-like NADH-dependent reductase (Old Yellow Enzyme family)